VAGTSGQGFSPADEYLRSVQCKSPQLMQAKDLDPSLALGFYMRNEMDFEEFCRRVKALRVELEGKGLLCPFSVEKAPPDYEKHGGVAAMMASLEEDEDDDDTEGEADAGSRSDLEDEYVVIGRN
jgi:hypothetical protein